MEGWLSVIDQKQVERFVQAGPKVFKLLYSFTRNGAEAATFHKFCDNKGPTVTVIYDTEGSVYGGFTEKSWTSGNGGYYRDEHAFLFQLKQNGCSAPIKFPVKTADSAIYCYSSAGPVFGDGHDLNTFSGTLTVENGRYTSNTKSKFGKTYDMAGVLTSPLTNDINTFKDLEVYSVTESVLIPVWRDIDGWEQRDLEELKNEIESFSPTHGLGIKWANILFLGPVGAGKSSFFNTISAVFRSHTSTQAICGNAEQSITSKYHIYRVRGSALSKPMKFRLCDTRGLEENQGIDATELSYLLEGNVPNGYQFNPSTPISPDMPGFIAKPTLNEKIHCVCFIIDGSTATVMSEKLIEKIKSLQSRVRQKEIPQVVLATKIDKVCAHVEEDISTVFQSVAIQDLVEKVSNILGVPRSNVLPVKNYEKEINVKTDISILALMSLRQILRATEDFMFNILDSFDNKDSETVE